MKFCCSDFEGFYSVKNELAPNIRIVKFNSEYLVSKKSITRVKSKRKDIKFFITPGYNTFKLLAPLMNIDFCPFCGKNLHKFYEKEEYFNEVEGVTFSS
ncbi:hypothetical protein SLH46_11240 [Draconibacterium sp. IB214405]|uniref:hypothetical protein n=1 Tax=Draconibacterium sp. IB214405 TaxID=3097352 RepID=UPI002A140A42|nr:hypothetical protein [Draconibacterium sp. IB214405]MDX8339761.1 hypothetical protein [Draconibacterium sp. IB214405]